MGHNFIFISVTLGWLTAGPTSHCDFVFLSNTFFYLPKVTNTQLLVFRFLYAVVNLFLLFVIGDLDSYGFDYSVGALLDLIPTAIQLELYPTPHLVYFWASQEFLWSCIPKYYWYIFFNLLVSFIGLWFSIRTNDKFSFYLQFLHIFALYCSPYTLICFPFLYY